MANSTSTSALDKIQSYAEVVKEQEFYATKAERDTLDEAIMKGWKDSTSTAVEMYKVYSDHTWAWPQKSEEEDQLHALKEMIEKQKSAQQYPNPFAGIPLAPQEQFSSYGAKPYKDTPLPSTVSQFFEKVILSQKIQNTDCSGLCVRLTKLANGLGIFDLMNKSQVMGDMVMFASCTIRSADKASTQFEIVEKSVFNNDGTRELVTEQEDK